MSNNDKNDMMDHGRLEDDDGEDMDEDDDDEMGLE